jgi:YidC/Oxa1 family membrane protein insertase
MVAGGMYWFPDLTVADPYYGLPLLCSASFLATVELGAADGMQGMPPESLSRMKTFFRFIAVAMIPLSSGMPAVSFNLLCELARPGVSTRWK